MPSRNRLADRRENVRFETTGQLWADRYLASPAVLRNLGLRGALIETRLPPAMNAIRAAQVALRDGGPVLNAIVRHVTPVTSAPEEDRHLVGLEFVNPSPSARAEIDAMLRAAGNASGQRD